MKIEFLFRTQWKNIFDIENQMYGLHRIQKLVCLAWFILKTSKSLQAQGVSCLPYGAKIEKKAQEVFWGGYSGYFKDPDGHLWEVAHNPLVWIGPKDEDQP